MFHQQTTRVHKEGFDSVCCWTYWIPFETNSSIPKWRLSKQHKHVKNISILCAVEPIGFRSKPIFRFQNGCSTNKQHRPVKNIIILLIHKHRDYWTIWNRIMYTHTHRVKNVDWVSRFVADVVVVVSRDKNNNLLHTLSAFIYLWTNLGGKRVTGQESSAPERRVKWIILVRPIDERCCCCCLYFIFSTPFTSNFKGTH